MPTTGTNKAPTFRACPALNLVRSQLSMPLAAGLLAMSALLTVADAALQPPHVAPSTVAPHARVPEPHSGDKLYPPDRSGKGAVTCAWEILLAAEAAGDSCPATHDGKFDADLKALIARVDDFIMRNSGKPVTPLDLQARRALAIQRLGPAGVGICKGGAFDLYRRLQASGVDHLRSWIDDLLSIPREPVMNPCL